MKKLFQIFAILLAGVVAMGLFACNNNAGNDTLVLSPTSLTFESASGEKYVNVTGTQWTASVNADWVTIDPMSGTDGIITVSVTANDTGVSRVATLTVVNAAGAKIVSIEQGVPGELMLDPVSLEFESVGDTKSVTVASETSWTVVSNDTSWLTVTKTGDAGFTVTATVNDGGERTTTITVENAVGSKAIAVKQKKNLRDPEAELVLSGTGQYMGDMFEVGQSTYFLELYTCERGEFGDLIGDGAIISVDIFSEYPADLRNPEIASGVYTYSESNEKFTIHPAEWDDIWEEYISSMVAIIEDGWFADVPYAIIEGSTIEVDNKGDGNYELAFNLNLSDGSTYKAYYNGPLEVTNVVLMSNLEEDYAIPSLTKGKFTVRPWSNGTNLYSGVLYSDGLNPDAGTGTGDELTLRIHTEPHNDYYTITSGNYTIAGNYDAGTVRAGYTVYGIPTDSWYRGIVNGQIKQFAPLVSGQVNIQYNSGTYTIAIDAYDDFGNNITGTFQGPITITDYVGAPTAPDEAQMSYIYTAPEYNSAAQTRTNNSRRLRNMR